MSRILFWNDEDICKEIILNENECRFKCNGMCYNNRSKKLGKKCHHRCEDFTEENGQVTLYEKGEKSCTK